MSRPPRKKKFKHTEAESSAKGLVHRPFVLELAAIINIYSTCWLLATFKFVKHLSPGRFVCQAHTHPVLKYMYTPWYNSEGTKRGENECKHTRLQLQALKRGEGTKQKKKKKIE